MVRQVRSSDFFTMPAQLGHPGGRIHDYWGGDVAGLDWLLPDFTAVGR
jgi:hypothetical protein